MSDYSKPADRVEYAAGVWEQGLGFVAWSQHRTEAAAVAAARRYARRLERSGSPHTDNFFDLIREVELNQDARTAARENNLRRQIATLLDEHRQAKGLSLRDLAKEMGTSLSQVQRILHHELGGNLTLRTLVRATDALGLHVTVNIRSRCHVDAKIVPMGETIEYQSWEESPDVTGDIRAFADECSLMAAMIRAALTPQPLTEYEHQELEDEAYHAAKQIQGHAAAIVRMLDDHV